MSESVPIIAAILFSLAVIDPYKTTPYPMETMSSMKSEILFRPELRMATTTSSAMAKNKEKKLKEISAPNLLHRTLASFLQLTRFSSLVIIVPEPPVEDHLDHQKQDHSRDEMLNSEDLAPMSGAQNHPGDADGCINQR